MTQAPFRRQVWGKESVTLSADHAAWYTLEKVSKRAHLDTVEDFLALDRDTMEPAYLLLWAFGATHRDDSRIHYEFTKEEREFGGLVPRSFLRQIPTGQDYKGIEASLVHLLVEAELASPLPVEEVPAQPGPPLEPSPESAVQSTGDGGF